MTDRRHVRAELHCQRAAWEAAAEAARKLEQVPDMDLDRTRNLVIAYLRELWDHPWEPTDADGR